MDAVWQWGLEFIRTIQLVHGPALDAFFKAITFMGEEEFFLLLVPLVFWCVDFVVGARLAFAFIIGYYCNAGLKEIFAHPRPFTLDPTVGLHHGVTGYGLPSGHSQSSVVVWGVLATQFRKRWLWVVAISLMILIGFSRVYLGVHFPTDVLAGWTVGAVFLAAFVVLGPRIEDWLKSTGLAVQLALAVGLSLVMGLIFPGPVDKVITTIATLGGMGVGLALYGRLLSFDAGGSTWLRVKRFLVGVVGLAFVYFGLKIAFPGEGEPFYTAMRLVRYGLVGVWVTFGAPWLFVRLKLSADDEWGQESLG